jgi:hypothetical protein
VKMTERYNASHIPSTDTSTPELLMTVSHPHASESSDGKTSKEVNDPTGEPASASDAAPVDVYPGDHGDWRAILCSVGAFFTLFIGFGILNIPGTFVTYWENNQLKEYSQSQISWIAAMQFFLTLFGSVFTGRLFDLYGGRVYLSEFLN